MPTDPDPDRAAPLPSHLGHYRILRVLGEGGMGVVYEAEQDNPRRTVALKVVRPGLAQPSLLRRFEAEAQVLGRLQHPGIAQIYEAGTHDDGQGPQLFFAMELVIGESLIDYASSRKLGTRQRLQLMAKICDAVHHAHQKGVIHRDLKPDNILVNEDGQPKVLDFGVARSTNADVQTATLRTDVGQLMGTVPYMSPEQVTADPDQLDLRSDVYALGVVMYELLAGRLPYDLSRKMIHEVARIIREEEPTPLSSANRLLRGDVETIVQKALEKDRDRRYGSASDLGTDIGHYLDDEPINARPPSAAYQFRKFAQRHRGLVGGIIAVFVALVAGTIVSVAQAVRASAAEVLSEERAQIAEQSEREARAQMEQSDAVRAFLQNMLRSADPYAGNDPDVTVRHVLDSAAAAVERDALEQQPGVEAAVRIAVGSTYHSLGAYDRAEPHLQRALELFHSEHGEDHPDVAESRFWLANLAATRGDFTVADTELAASTAGFRAEFGDDHPRVARGLQMLSTVRYNQERLVEAKKIQREALEMRRRLFGEQHIDVAESLVHLGFLLRYEGDYDGAEAVLREAAAITRLRLGDDHPGVASALSHLGDVLVANGGEGAEEILREALAITRRFFVEKHPRVPDLLWRLGELVKSRRHYADAEPLLREALQKRRDLLGPHRDTATSLASLGEALLGAGRVDEAEPVLEEALAMRRELYGDDGLAVAASLTDLGELRMRQRRSEVAEPLLREAMVIWGKATDKDEVGRCRTLYALGMLLQGRRDYAGAETAFRELLQLRKSLHGENHLRVAEGENVLASLLYRKGDKAAAEAMFRAALDGFRGSGLSESVRVLDVLSNLAFVVGARGDLATAEGLLRDAADISARLKPGGFYSPSHTLGRLATNLGKQEKAAEYEASARAALQLAEEEFPAGHWELWNARRRIGHALTKLARHGDAEALLLESHAALAAGQNVPPNTISAAIDALIELYDAWGKTAEAARWREAKK